MSKTLKKILVYGYGNPGRQDDALGVKLAEEIDAWSKEKDIAGIYTDSNYQLNIEDAAEISDKDIVVFADASIVESVNDFYLSVLEPSAKVEFTMHAVSPAFVLHLCKEIYSREPETYLLHIRGYEWELKEGLTKEANENLIKAVKHIKEFIVSKVNQ